MLPIMLTSYALAFLAYFFILIVIGVISHRRQTSNAEFIVGRRSLSFWLTALSAHASDMSAWLFMGLPAAIYIKGLSGSWIAIGLLAGMFLNWQFIARKLREQTEALDCYTLSAFFEKRFADKSGIIRLLTATTLLFFLTHYLSAALMAMGLLLESVFMINYYWGLFFATVVIVGYTFAGGFVTIAWIDLFQGLFLLGIIMLVPLFALGSITDPFSVFRGTAVSGEGYISLFGDLSARSVAYSMLLAISWGLGYFGMPHIITKFMGIRDPEEIKKSKYVGMSWQFMAFLSAILVGLVGFVFFQGGLRDPQLVFVEMVKSLFNPFSAGFVLCAILAANLSTMDSQLLVAASIIGEDLYKKFFKSVTCQIQPVRASRAGVLIIAAFALFIAFRKEEAIMETVFYAWTGLGATFGPLVIMALYSRKANKNGAVAGILTGGLVAGFWPWFRGRITDMEISGMVPGFFLGMAAIWLVSNIYPVRRKS